MSNFKHEWHFLNKNATIYRMKDQVKKYNFSMKNVVQNNMSQLIAFKAMFSRVIIHASPQGIIPSVYLSIRIIKLNRTMR